MLALQKGNYCQSENAGRSLERRPRKPMDFEKTGRRFVQPIPIRIDVLLSLQTGIVDTVFSSTQGTLVFQWFTIVKYIKRLRMGYATGGVLISKKKFKKLPPAYQEALQKVRSELFAELAVMI